MTTVGQLVLTVGAQNPLYVNTPRVADDRSRSRRVSDLLARAARPGLDVVWASSSPKMSSPKEPKYSNQLGRRLASRTINRD